MKKPEKPKSEPINDMPLKLTVRAVRWALAKADSDKVLHAKQRARRALSLLPPSKDKDD